MPRLPEIFERDALPEDQREVHDYLVKTRGAVSGGFAPFLHSPELVARVAHLGTYIRFESTLPAKTRELLALTASSELDNAYERTIHGRDAIARGASQALVDAVIAKRELGDAPDDEVLPVSCARELIRDHALSDATFATAHKELGDQGVVELIGTIGYYAMLAYNHNAMQVTLPST
jgi:4-carboxymuconolactone decarboxylase